MNASANELQRIPDVGEVVGTSIHQFFQEPHNRELVTRLKKAGVKPTVESRKKSDSAIGGTTDRKSTRLNSSHTVISYAVFCLKKKKKHILNDRTNKQTQKKGRSKSI